MAARAGKDGIEQPDLEEARDKVWWGRERKSRVLDNDEKRLTAYHEAGHAVVMALVEGGEPIHKVTIIPRGMALGATMFLPEKDRLHFTRTQMLAQLATAMGGRVAEEIFLDDISAGASQDLLQATNLARRMVCDWGMSEDLGPRTFGRREEMMFLGREVGRTQDFSEATAQKIDAEVDAILRQAYQKAHDILTSHRERVEALVVMLLEQETVDGEDAEDLIKLGRFRSQEEREADRKAREAAARARDGLPPLDEAGTKADGETAAKAMAIRTPASPDRRMCRRKQGMMPRRMTRRRTPRPRMTQRRMMNRRMMNRIYCLFNWFWTLPQSLPLSRIRRSGGDKVWRQSACAG